MADKKALLISLYDAISRQDVDGVLSLMHPDVDWPDTLDGGRIHGLAAMRDYWTRQFALIRVSTALIDYVENADGTIATRVTYTRFAADGRLWDDQVAGNIFRFEGDRILRGDWTDPPR